tara:strand:- start:119 stop:1051 length:933 start_codon:yes stop_codon:yes gene_type:complete
MVRRGIEHKTLFTGQHKDIVPKNATYVYEMIEYEGNRLNSVLKNCLSMPEEYFEGVDYILVQGDTTSVVGLALAALHRKIKVIHLEAGLRTYDTKNPYPEENNRRIVSTLANIHLCPTDINRQNLYLESAPGSFYVVGNTVLDNLVAYKEDCQYLDKVLVTMHRRENHDKIQEWFKYINELAIEYPLLDFILPVHPNPNISNNTHLLPNVKLIKPLSHDDLLELLIKCKMVITDSGGIQEECSFFNKKCLVCREITERPESVGLSSFMVHEPNELKDLFTNHIQSPIIDIESPYGDGYASEKICDILEKL